MHFEKASEVEQVCQQMLQADYPRGRDRALIDGHFNGAPPYTAEEVEENKIFVNVSDLTALRVAHNARSQFAQNFLKPGQYFSAKTDVGPAHKRAERSSIVTTRLNRIMKRSLKYYECYRSKFASNVLHGIGPAVWGNQDIWCPTPIEISDLLIPATTLLSFEDLPHFAVRRTYTAPMLIKLVRTAKRDAGWNLPLVQECIRWIDKQAATGLANDYGDIWSPEQQQERMKGSGSVYGADAVPTVNVFDFFYWSDEDKKEGWRRRIILDAWNDEGKQRSTELPGKQAWLYNSKDRVYAQKREHIFSCQFADLSAKAPFRYHSVRSLGFLMYSPCQLQNRLRCKFNEAVFEALTMLFRVGNEDDVQRALKVNLINRGVVDKSLDFIPASERFQVNSSLVQLGLNENQRLIDESAAAYRQNPDYSRDSTEKTKFQVMAEMNASTQLVSAAVQQAYEYQRFEYMEVFRRFLNKNSTDADVLEFRAQCLKEGIPESALSNAAAWDIEPERVMGNGNKSMEMAIAQQLMQMRMAFDPDPQRQILHDVVLAMTDDPGRARSLVPQKPEVTNSIHDAQMTFGSLMTGAPMAIKGGINRQEYIQALLMSMGAVVQRVQQTGPTIQEVIGLQNVGKHLAENIEVLAQDEDAGQLVKQFGDLLGRMMNMVKSFAQNLAEAQQQGEGGQSDPKLQAELQAELIKAQAKVQNQSQSHAQRTAQRQVQFEMQEKRKDEELQNDLRRREAEAALDQRLKLMEEQIKVMSSLMQKPPQQA